MLFKEIITAYFEKQRKHHKHTVWAKLSSFNVKAGGTCNYQCSLKGLTNPLRSRIFLMLKLRAQKYQYFWFFITLTNLSNLLIHYRSYHLTWVHCNCNETPFQLCLGPSGFEHYTEENFKHKKSRSQITDMESLKPDVKWGKILNRGTSEGEPTIYT
jgi:hypothetical protein